MFLRVADIPYSFSTHCLGTSPFPFLQFFCRGCQADQLPELEKSKELQYPEEIHSVSLQNHSLNERNQLKVNQGFETPLSHESIGLNNPPLFPQKIGSFLKAGRGISNLFFLSNRCIPEQSHSPAQFILHFSKAAKPSPPQLKLPPLSPVKYQQTPLSLNFCEFGFLPFPPPRPGVPLQYKRIPTNPRP